MSLRDAWETRASGWVRRARPPELDDDCWDVHLPALLAPDGRFCVAVMHPALTRS
jgi:hypothetical protein